jgi:hypothetical protein
VHVASWPYCDSAADGAPPAFSSDAQIVQSKFAALEGQMFVISSTQTLSRKNAELCGCVPWILTQRNHSLHPQRQGRGGLGNACKSVCYSDCDD